LIIFVFYWNFASLFFLTFREESSVETNDFIPKARRNGFAPAIQQVYEQINKKTYMFWGQFGNHMSYHDL